MNAPKDGKNLQSSADAGQGRAGKDPSSLNSADPRPSRNRKREKESREEQYRQEAAAIKQVVFSGSMACAMRLEKTFSNSAYRAYLDDFVDELGAKDDPISSMMAEQLAMLHFRIGDLHALAGASPATEVNRMLSGMAVRLQAEFRKTSQALRERLEAQPRRDSRAQPRLRRSA